MDDPKTKSTFLEENYGGINDDNPDGLLKNYSEEEIQKERKFYTRKTETSSTPAFETNKSPVTHVDKSAIDRYTKAIKKMSSYYGERTQLPDKTPEITTFGIGVPQEETGISNSLVNAEVNTDLDRSENRITYLDLYKIKVSDLEQSAKAFGELESKLKMELSKVGAKITMGQNGETQISSDKGTESKIKEILGVYGKELDDLKINYYSALANFKTFQDANKDMFLDDNTLKNIGLGRHYGNEYEKNRIQAADLYLMAKEIEKEKLRGIYGQKRKDITYEEASELRQAQDIIALTSEFKDRKSVNLKDYPAFTAKQMIKGFWDSTVGLIGEVGYMFDPNSNPDWSKWDAIGNKHINSTSVNDETISKLYKSAISNNLSTFYNSDFDKFMGESAEQFGMMGAFILSMYATGALSTTAKIAIQSEKVAETLTMGQFLKQVVFNPKSVSPLVYSGLLKSAESGVLMTFPTYYNEQRDKLLEIPVKDRTFWDYAGLAVLPLIKSSMEGMSEMIGSYALGTVIDKTFSAMLKNSSLFKGQFGKAILYGFTQNLGEVAEERINSIIDYTQYALTGKYQASDGKEYTNFGDFLKDQAKQSLYEFAMFSLSSGFYGKIFSKTMGAPSSIIDAYKEKVQNDFYSYLEEKYPELVKIKKDVFKIAFNDAIFLKTAKKNFDSTYQEILGRVRKEVRVFRNGQEVNQEKKIKKFVEDELKGVVSKSRAMSIAATYGITHEIVKEMAKIDSTIRTDFENLSSKEVVETLQKVSKIILNPKEIYDNGTSEHRDIMLSALTTHYDNLKNYSITSGKYGLVKGITYREMLDFHLGKDNYEVHYLRTNESGVPDTKNKDLKGISFDEVFDKLQFLPDEDVDKEVLDAIRSNGQGLEVVFYKGDLFNRKNNSITAFMEGNVETLSPTNNKIYINVDSLIYKSNNPQSTLMHEALHQITLKKISTDKSLRNEILKIRQEYLSKWKDSLSKEEKSGLLFDSKGQDIREAGEFISFMFQSNSFKSSLELSGKGNETFWEKVKDFFAKIFPFLKVKTNNYEAIKQIILTSAEDTKNRSFDYSAEEESSINVYQSGFDEYNDVDVKNFIDSFDSGKDIIVFDVETTGTNTDYNDIIQISGIKIRDGNVIEQFNEFLDTGQDLEESSKVHGITPKILEDSVKHPRRKVFLEFLKFIGEDSIIMGHEIERFDIPILLSNLGRLYLADRFKISNTFDSRHLSSLILAHEPTKYSLKSLSEYFSLGDYKAHDSMEDVRMNYEVIKLLKEKAKDYLIQSIYPVQKSEQESKDDIENALSGEQLKLMEQALEEFSRGIDITENNIQESFLGLAEAGLVLFEEGKEREQLYDFISKNPEYKDFDKFVRSKIDEISNVEVKSRIQKFIEDKNKEYLRRSATNFDFLEKLHMDGLSLKKYNYITVEQSKDRPFDGNLIIEHKGDTFTNAYGNSKSGIQRRLMIENLVEMLEKKGIKIKPYIIDHFISYSESGERSTQSKLPDFRIAGTADKRLSNFRLRMFKEGYLVLPTEKGETFAFKIDEIEILDKETGEWRMYKPVVYSEASGSKNNAYSRTISSITSQVGYADRILGQGRGQYFLLYVLSNIDKSLLKKYYINEFYFKDVDKEKLEGLTLYDFLEKYENYIGTKHEITDLAQRKEDGEYFSRHEVYLSFVSDLCHYFFFKELFYKNLLEGTKNDLEILKRSTFLKGKATKSVVSSRIKKMLKKNKKETNGIWYDERTGKVQVRYGVMDLKTIPQHIRNEMGISSETKIGDGTSFMQRFAMRVLFAMNRSFTDKQGSVTKFKTFTKKGVMIKNGVHIAPYYGDKGITNLETEETSTHEENSVLAEFMRLNKIAELHDISAIKIGKEKMSTTIITWDDIVNLNLVKDSSTGIRDLSESSHVQDGKSDKKNAGGFLPVIIRTFLSTKMDTETRKALKDIVKEYVSNFNNSVRIVLENPSIMSKLLNSFNEANTFNSATKKAIRRALKNGQHDGICYFDYIKDYFNSGYMTNLLRDMFKFKQSNGRYPAITVDLGMLTSYREQLLYSNQITEEEAKKYFTESGFIKEGYCMCSEDIFDELSFKKNSEAIITIVPPAGMQDIKAVKLIGFIKGSNSLVMNNKQAQDISGRDFDFDKLLILNCSSPNYKKIWNFVNSSNFELEYLENKKHFETLITDSEFNFWKKEMHDPELKKETAVMLSLFGKSDLSKTGINLSLPPVYDKAMELITKNFISIVYDIAVEATHMSSSKQEEIYINYDSFGNPYEVSLFKSSKEGDTSKPIDFSVNKYKISLLSVLTHHSLDWQSSPDILMYNMSPEMLVKSLYKLDTLQEAKVVLDFMKERTKPLMSIARESGNNINNMSQLMYNLKSAAEFLDLDFYDQNKFKKPPKKNDALTNNFPSFLSDFVEELSKIDLSMLDLTYGKKMGVDQNTLFKSSLQRYVNQEKDKGNALFSSKFIEAIETTCSLMNRISFASNSNSGTFSQSKNIKEMFYFARKLNSKIATQFIIEILKRKAYQVNSDFFISDVLNGKGSININELGRVTFYEGNGKGLIYFAKDSELWVEVHDFSDGKLDVKNSYKFTELYEKDPELVNRMFANPYNEENINSSTRGEDISSMLFSQEYGNLSLVRQQINYDISAIFVERVAKVFSNSDIYKKLPLKFKKQFFASLFGIFDVDFQKPQIQKEKSIYDSPYDEVSDEEFYKLADKKKKFGIALESVTSQTASKSLVKEIVRGKTEEETRERERKLEKNSDIKKVVTKKWENVAKRTAGEIKISVELKEESSYFRIVPFKMTNYATAQNLLASIAIEKGKDSVEETIENDILSIMEIVADPKSLLPVNKSIIPQSTIEDESIDKENDRNAIKNLLHNPNLSDREIDEIVADCFNYEESVLKSRGQTINTIDYLRKILANAGKHSNVGIIKRILGYTFPINRLYEILGQRNILLFPSFGFNLYVFGKKNTINSDFMCSILDRYNPLGRPDTFSGSQINWCVQTQLHYLIQTAIENSKKTYEQLLSITSNKGNEHINASLSLQKLIYDIADNTKYKIMDLLSFSEFGNIVFKDNDYRVFNSPYSFTLGTEEYYKEGNKYILKIEESKVQINKTKYESAYKKVQERINSKVLKELASEVLKVSDINILTEEKEEENKDNEQIKDIKIKVISAAIGLTYINLIEVPDLLERFKNDLAEISKEVDKHIISLEKKAKINKLINSYSQSLEYNLSRIQRKSKSEEKENEFYFPEKSRMPKFYQNEKDLLKVIMEIKSKQIAIEKLIFLNEGEILPEVQKSVSKRYKTLKKVYQGMPINANQFGVDSELLTGYLSTLDVTSRAIDFSLSGIETKLKNLYAELMSDYVNQDNEFMQKQTEINNLTTRSSKYLKHPIEYSKIRKGTLLSFTYRPTDIDLFKKGSKKAISILEKVEQISKRKDLPEWLSNKIRGLEEEIFKIQSLPPSKRFNQIIFQKQKMIEELKKNSLRNFYLSVCYSQLGMDSYESIKSMLNFTDYFRGYDKITDENYMFGDIAEAKYIFKLFKNCFNNEFNIFTEEQQDRLLEIGIDPIALGISVADLELTKKFDWEQNYKLDFEEEVVGKVESIDEEGIKILEIGEKDVDDKDKKYLKNRITSTNIFAGIHNIEKLSRIMQTTFGINFGSYLPHQISEVVNKFAHLWSKATDFTLLMFFNTTYSLQNLIGARINLGSYIGFSAQIQDSSDPNAKVGIFDRTSLTKLSERFQKIINTPEKITGDLQEFYADLQKNIAVILGGYQKLFGKFSGILDDVDEYNASKIEMNNNLQMKYISDIQEMEDFVNSRDVEGFTPSKIKGIMSKAKEMAMACRLYNPLAFLFSSVAPTLFDPLESEKSNRFVTMALGTYVLMNNIKYGDSLSKEDEQIAKKIVHNIVFAKLQQINQNTQFQYIPALFLSRIDSTSVGRVLGRYSHYGNSLEHVFWKRLSNIRRQCEDLGIPFTELLSSHPSGVPYKSIIRNSGKNIQINYREDNEARRYVRLGCVSLALIFLRIVASRISRVIALTVIGESIYRLVAIMMPYSMANGYNVKSIAFLIDILRYCLNLILKKDDDDEDKVSEFSPDFYMEDTWDKLLKDSGIKNPDTWKNILIGESYEGYLKKHKNRLIKEYGKVAEQYVNDAMYFRDFHSKWSQDIIRNIPFIGVGEAQLVSILSNLLIFSTMPEGLEWEDVMKHELSKIGETVIPGSKVIREFTPNLLLSGTSTSKTKELEQILSYAKDKNVDLTGKIGKELMNLNERRTNGEIKTPEQLMNEAKDQARIMKKIQGTKDKLKIVQEKLNQFRK